MHLLPSHGICLTLRPCIFNHTSLDSHTARPYNLRILWSFGKNETYTPPGDFYPPIARFVSRNEWTNPLFSFSQTGWGQPIHRL